MIKKATTPLDEHDLTLEVASLPVTKSGSETLPVIDEGVQAEVQAPSNEVNKDPQDIKSLALKIAELEDKFAKLQTELTSHLSKKKKKKKIKENKDKKVKCKCKKKSSTR